MRLARPTIARRRWSAVAGCPMRRMTATSIKLATRRGCLQM
jgi:hypothetical protein